MRDDAVERKHPPLDSTLLVDPTTLTPETNTSTPFVEQASIPTPLSDVGLSVYAASIRPPLSTVARPPLILTLIY